jgi:hypothetical protein
LIVYATDGRLPIDNNQVERLMKRIAIGHKNWLFIGSVRAGIRNAGLMSLVASAQRQEIDIGMYLESAITHLLRGTARPEELLPDRWKANHPEAVRNYREQERRDKADTATLSAAKRRARQQLKKLTQQISRGIATRTPNKSAGEWCTLTLHWSTIEIDCSVE